MPIFERDGKSILFIHIPKTGGVSIVDWLSHWGNPSFVSMTAVETFRCNCQHFMMSDFNYLFRSKRWDFIFTVIREPHDRIESEYCWRVALMPDKSKPPIAFSNWLESSHGCKSSLICRLDNPKQPGNRSWRLASVWHGA
jgi:Sulfotransferase family